MTDVENNPPITNFFSINIKITRRQKQAHALKEVSQLFPDAKAKCIKAYNSFMDSTPQVLRKKVSELITEMKSTIHNIDTLNLTSNNQAQKIDSLQETLNRQELLLSSLANNIASSKSLKLEEMDEAIKSFKATLTKQLKKLEKHQLKDSDIYKTMDKTYNNLNSWSNLKAAYTTYSQLCTFHPSAKEDSLQTEDKHISEVLLSVLENQCKIDLDDLFVKYSAKATEVWKTLSAKEKEAFSEKNNHKPIMAKPISKHLRDLPSFTR